MSDVELDVTGAAPSAAPSALKTLEYIAKSIVEDAASVVVETAPGRNGQTDLRLHVGADDMGRIIGRRGRTAAAIRTVVKAVAAEEGADVFVDIVD